MGLPDPALLLTESRIATLHSPHGACHDAEWVRPRFVHDAPGRTTRLVNAPRQRGAPTRPPGNGGEADRRATAAMDSQGRSKYRGPSQASETQAGRGATTEHSQRLCEGGRNEAMRRVSSPRGGSGAQPPHPMTAKPAAARGSERERRRRSRRDRCFGQPSQRGMGNVDDDAGDRRRPRTIMLTRLGPTDEGHLRLV